MPSTTMTTDSRFWDRLAERYARQPIADEANYMQTLEKTRLLLSPEDDVLELGCGTGMTALKLADRVHALTATDFAPGMVAQARARLALDPRPNVRFETAGVDDAPAGPFDAVLAFNLLHLLPDLDAALARIARRVGPGGLFVSKTPCLGPHRLWMRPLIGALRATGRAPRIATMFDPRRLEIAIEGAGFEIEESVGYRRTPVTQYVVARRR